MTSALQVREQTKRASRSMACTDIRRFCERECRGSMVSKYPQALTEIASRIDGSSSVNMYHGPITDAEVSAFASKLPRADLTPRDGVSIATRETEMTYRLKERQSRSLAAEAR